MFANILQILRKPVCYVGQSEAPDILEMNKKYYLYYLSLSKSCF